MRTIRDCGELAPAYDIVVIGAGPAGMAAAASGAALGLTALLVDENAAPGGQIYRAITTMTLRARELLGADFSRGSALVEELERSDAHYAPVTTAWHVGPTEGGQGMQVGVALRGEVRMLDARRLILATGALERPFPIPGWTLPGVMTAGSAQIALKSASLVPGGRTVVAGCGPLLYLLAAQLQAVGSEQIVLLETTPAANRGRALPELADFLRSPYLLKGLKLLASARRGLRIIGGVTELRAEGGERLECVSFRRGDGSAVERLPADLLLLHQGVVPNINFSNAIGCRHDWDDAQLAFIPRLDDWMRSTVGHVSIAGDGAGIAGAECAPLRGRLAALGAALDLGRIGSEKCDDLAAPVRAALARMSRGRRFLDRLYRPARQFRVPTDADTIVCRCEEVPAGRLREALALGTPGPNQLKTFLRCGMGPCQGRLCGLTVTEMIGEARRVSPDVVGYYRLRTPIKPISVAELATLPHTEGALRAVDR
jgi:NADPH-dependent 2,4-dienoyl-CoA reductase/sulfur reductase-like enzyme